ncbi:MAG: transcriptional repressor LexA [Armatimonadetes bacterium]|nr:transcriptional repressor LexA [Armatimonadota bacterium]
MKKALTPKQQAILRYIEEYIENRGFPPSIREIGERFNIKSLRGVTVHLDALKSKGYIERESTPRSIKVIGNNSGRQSNTTALPLYGNVAAGNPIYSENNVQDHISVPSEMVRNIKNAFLLRIQGDSMIGDGILPHDLVIIKPQDSANHNDLVAVQLEDGATVKRYSVQKDGIVLLPSNPSHDPIPVRTESAWVLGKVVGLLRDYQAMAF